MRECKGKPDVGRPNGGGGKTDSSLSVAGDCSRDDAINKSKNKSNTRRSISDTGFEVEEGDVKLELENEAGSERDEVEGGWAGSFTFLESLFLLFCCPNSGRFSGILGEVVDDIPFLLLDRNNGLLGGPLSSRDSSNCC